MLQDAWSNSLLKTRPALKLGMVVQSLAQSSCGYLQELRFHSFHGQSGLVFWPFLFLPVPHHCSSLIWITLSEPSVFQLSSFNCLPPDMFSITSYYSRGQLHSPFSLISRLNKHILFKTLHNMCFASGPTLRDATCNWLPRVLGNWLLQCNVPANSLPPLYATQPIYTPMA